MLVPLAHGGGAAALCFLGVVAAAVLLRPVHQDEAAGELVGARG